MAAAERVPDYVREYPEVGITIEYFDGRGAARKYLVSCPTLGIERERFTSVTTITNAYDSGGGMLYAAAKIGVEGAIALARDGWLPDDVEQALAVLRARKLTHWDVWGAKAALGTAAHQDLEALAAGKLQDLDYYAPQVRGFIRGISAWMADYNPTVIASEVPVTSIFHKFAGRFDWLVDLDLPLYGTRGIVDLKTTEELPRDDHGLIKPPYEEHALQVRLYDMGARECGYPPTDWQGILRVDQRGNYDFTLGWVDDAVAQACITGYRGFTAVGKGAPRPKPLTGGGNDEWLY